MITKAPRGVQDWYGERMALRSYLEGVLREQARTFNISEIITPMFEHTVLFTRGVGETTDIVQKEMYTFEDKGGRSITLKPEGTASCMRAYLENGLTELPSPLKLFYVTPAFRYEKPQSGRLRQHHQFGIEIIGSPCPVVEMELIRFASSFFKKIGLKNISLHINSIGHKESRDRYNAELINFLHSHEEELCPLCRDRMERNPLRTLDCKEEKCSNIMKDAPRTLDYLNDEDKENFEILLKLLDNEGIDYTVDSGLVRGLDYYTGTVFEFVNEEGLAICGGGRYDGLIKEIDGKREVPSVGFGMGLERLIDVLTAAKAAPEIDLTPDYYIGFMGYNAYPKAMEIVEFLRNKGFRVESDNMDRSVKAQMKFANKIGAKRVIIIGDDEVKNNLVSLKNMTNSETREVSLDNMEDLIDG